MGVTNADAFRMLFEGLYASELWSMTEDKFLEWLNSDYTGSASPMMKRWCLRMADWRSDAVTEKQLVYIQEMQEFSDFPIPRFTGSTKGEASDYID